MRLLMILDEKFEEYLVVLLLGAMSLIIGLQVFMRYVMQESLYWSEEIARYMFIWLICIGISYGVKKNRHICVDTIFNLLPERAARWFSILADLLFLAFAIFVTCKGLEVVQGIFRSGQTSAALEAPMWTVYTAVPVGFGLVIVRLMQNILSKVRAIRGATL